MSLKINYKKGASEKTIKNFVLFSNEDFKVNGLNKLSIVKNSSQINKTISSYKSKKKEFISFNVNSDQRVILIKIKQNNNSTENEKKGANFYNFVKSNSLSISCEKRLGNSMNPSFFPSLLKTMSSLLIYPSFIPLSSFISPLELM